MRLREAFMVVDPEIKHGQMIQHLRLCFRCSTDQLDDIEPLDTSILLERMSKSGIYRQGKKYWKSNFNYFCRNSQKIKKISRKISFNQQINRNKIS